MRPAEELLIAPHHLQPKIDHEAFMQRQARALVEAADRGVYTSLEQALDMTNILAVEDTRPQTAFTEDVPLSRIFRMLDNVPQPAQDGTSLMAPLQQPRPRRRKEHQHAHPHQQAQPPSQPTPRQQAQMLLKTPRQQLQHQWSPRQRHPQSQPQQQLLQPQQHSQPQPHSHAGRPVRQPAPPAPAPAPYPAGFDTPFGAPAPSAAFPPPAFALPPLPHAAASPRLVAHSRMEPVHEGFPPRRAGGANKGGGVTPRAKVHFDPAEASLLAEAARSLATVGQHQFRGVGAAGEDESPRAGRPIASRRSRRMARQDDHLDHLEEMRRRWIRTPAGVQPARMELDAATFDDRSSAFITLGADESHLMGEEMNDILRDELTRRWLEQERELNRSAAAIQARYKGRLSRSKLGVP